MNAAATHTLRLIPDITFAYGVSDEYSFIFDRNTSLFERRRDKLCSTVVSTFTSAYIYYWPTYFNNPNLELPESYAPASTTATSASASGALCELRSDFLPSFDARAVIYPTALNLRDYLSWRQVDCHINNLYNTTFWFMVLRRGMSEREAEEELKGSVSADKNEILWSRFGVNYNARGEWEKKGSVVYRDFGPRDVEYLSQGVDGEAQGQGARDGEEGDGRDVMSKTQREKMRKAKLKARIVVEHVDIIKDDFWEKRPWILGGKSKIVSA